MGVARLHEGVGLGAACAPQGRVLEAALLFSPLSIIALLLLDMVLELPDILFYSVMSRSTSTLWRPTALRLIQIILEVAKIDDW